ncbi:hypothetical protein [Variovorax sp. dw_954]|uniref:hypothetical protein n=1 Tax=Variovorax sp. dw_954 TaxID=2720078 RepID=UPI001BD1EF6E|nr:hypothetical protein [Variovorax sp. dw_954]
MPKLKQQMVGRLAALTSISTQGINEIQVPLHWEGPRTHFCYCARCVFVNPLDVTAPIWRREWLDWLATISLAGVLPHEGMLPGRLLSLGLLFNV